MGPFSKQRDRTLFTFVLFVLATLLSSIPAAAVSAQTGPFVQVAAGHRFSLALARDGSVWAWGEAGPNHDEATSARHVRPERVEGLPEIKAIAASLSRHVALAVDGSVWQWEAFASQPAPVNGLAAVIAVSTEYNRLLALRADGTVWVWQDGGIRQVPGLAGVTAIAGGGSHSLALMADGSVWAWGDNRWGQLGDGTREPQEGPVEVRGLTGVVSIAAGGMSSLAVKADGSLWAWGVTSRGQVRAGGEEQGSASPVRIPGLANVVSVSGGRDHAIAVTRGGDVYAWGENGWGQLGDGTNTPSRAMPVPVAGLSRVRSASAGASHSLALRADGTVWAWGWNGSGELGAGLPVSQAMPSRVRGLANVVAVAAGSGHSLAVGADGTLWTWGSGAAVEGGMGGVPVRVPGLTGVVQAAANASHSLALKSDGTVWAWGSNSLGQLGDGTRSNSTVPVRVQGLTNAVAITAGFAHSMALRADGTVWAWGAGNDGKLGNGSVEDQTAPVQVDGIADVVAVAVRGDSSYALQRGGTVWMWGHTRVDVVYHDRPVRVEGLERIVLIAAGWSTAFASDRDGSLWAWGYSTSGELGDGNRRADRQLPVAIAGVSNLTAVAGGVNHTVAVDQQGAVWAWGDNEDGQLGTGSAGGIIPSPIRAEISERVKGVAAGGSHSVALLEDGSVLTWGWNGSGQLGDGAQMIRYRPVRVAIPSEGGTVAGVVQDNQRPVQPVPGVIVTARTTQGDAVSTAVADGDGRYELEGLPAGSYTITAELAGYRTVSRSRVRLSSTESATVNLTLTPTTGTVTGRVTDTASKPLRPLAGALVGLLDRRGVQVAQTETADDGTYTLAGIPEGTHKVIISLADYKSATKSSARISGGRTTRADFRLGPVMGSVVGQVTDGRRPASPVAGAAVTLLTTRGETVAIGETDGQGGFHFDRVPEGAYRLVIAADDYKAPSATLRVQGAREISVSIKMAPAKGTIAVRVTANGRKPLPLADATVTVLDPQGNLLTESETGADGTWTSAHLPEGTYRVIVAREGFRSARAVTLKVYGGKTATANVRLIPQ